MHRNIFLPILQFKLLAEVAASSQRSVEATVAVMPQIACMRFGLKIHILSRDVPKNLCSFERVFSFEATINSCH